MPKKLNQIQGMPKMSVAFSGWKSQITLVVLSNAINANGFNVPTETTISFRGTIQPLSAEALELKPDAQRSFEWLQIHVETSDPNYTVLSVGDEIQYNDKPYRVKGKKDYTLNNYVEFHAMEVVQNG